MRAGRAQSRTWSAPRWALGYPADLLEVSGQRAIDDPHPPPTTVVYLGSADAAQDAAVERRSRGGQAKNSKAAGLDWSARRGPDSNELGAFR